MTKQLQLVLFTFLCISVNALTKIKTPDTSSCLQLSGKVLKLRTYSTNSYTVNLMRNEQLIESKVIKGNNEFKFDLKKNNFYAVKISKEGYVQRTIIVDTKLAEMHNGYYKFAFDTELIEESKADKLNAEALNMPIAHISFDERKRWFTYNAEYTKEIKRKIYSGHVQINK